MEPRFTRGEYWLLETAVEGRFPVSILMDSDLEVNLNKTGHGLTRDALIETLHRLIVSGLISVEHEVDGVISTHQHIERALDAPRRDPERKRTYYGLTQEGAAQWEAFAAPDWERYIRTSLHWPDHPDGFPDPPDGIKRVIEEAICADKPLLERYFKSKCFYRAKDVYLESVEWDYIAPWDVTYWKQLEGAHRVRFQARDVTEAQNVKRYPLWHPQFFRSLWCAWK